MKIVPMDSAMAEAVLEIYAHGVKSGRATFNTQIPTWSQWDAGHLQHSRLAATEDGSLAGWAALSPVSSRHPYRGVAEVSIYIHPDRQGRGLGTKLLESLIAGSEANGIWCLYAGILAENTRSLALVRRMGFREIGWREKIAEINGAWKDTVLLERRSRVVGWPEENARPAQQLSPSEARLAEHRNKQLIADLLLRVDRRDLADLGRFYAPDYREHNRDSAKNIQPGIAGVREAFEAFTAAFEDYSHQVHDLIAEGDRVTAHVTFRGRFVRPLFGHPPTGETVTATGIAIYRIADGKIAEKWGYLNALAALGIARPASS